MNDSIQFVTPGDHRPLVYEGETDTDGRWTDGILRTEDGDVSFPVEDGIPRFCPDAASFYDDEKSRHEVFRKNSIDPDRFIEQNRDGPFFLYLAFTIPHLAIQVPDDALAEYRGA